MKQMLRRQPGTQCYPFLKRRIYSATIPYLERTLLNRDEKHFEKSAWHTMLPILENEETKPLFDLPLKKERTCTKMIQLLRRQPCIQCYPFLKRRILKMLIEGSFSTIPENEITQPWFDLLLRKDPLAQRWKICWEDNLTNNITHSWKWENSAMIWPSNSKKILRRQPSI